MQRVTIVGRPNVGKSSLMNRIAGRRVSIVEPTAGVTRDRVAIAIEWQERHFELIDTGGLGGLATMGMAHWLTIEVDREDDSGYERTRKYDGYPAYETFVVKSGEIGSANLSIVVERRFIVQLHGADVRMEDVMSAADELDLDRLADLSKR